ncbi:MAG: CBS domain-containing protein, partial [Aquificaceae bacterium]|nr:CBS domain-containing protein [Aquificaceae bacterium]
MQKLIFLEEGADLDALSSAYGVMLIYEDAYLLKPRYLSKRASEVFGLFMDKFRLRDAIPECFDLVLVDNHNYEEYLKSFEGSIREVYIYDHHPRAPKGFKGKVDMVGSCTTLLVEELMEKGRNIDQDSATLLALGIYEDTGMLTYEGTTPRDARAVAWLLEKGLNLQLLRKFLSGGISKEEIDLLSESMTSFESLFFDGKRISIVVLKTEDYKPDILSLLYELRDVRESVAFFAIVEAGGKTYLFGRSIKSGFDVSQVLGKFGGGGHEFASAVKLEGVSGDRLKELLKSILKGEKVHLKVEEVMSHPPFLLHEDMDVETAILELSQRNFAGAPVVNSDGKLIGIVYKKNLLKAQRHGIKGKLKDFIVEDFHMLKPEDFLWKAEEVLSRHGEKLIPVVEGENIVGVITRLDLLQTYREHIKALKASEKRLNIPENIKGLLEKVGKEASLMGYRAYLVGG